MREGENDYYDAGYLAGQKDASDALEAQARRIAELERECGITSRYASKLEDVLRLINLASLKPNGSKEECGVIAREAINGHI
jgi:hypothetical protein